MKPTLKLAIVGVFVLAALAIVFLAKGGKATAPATTTNPQAKPTDKTVTTINVVYSTEKKEWIEAATADFQKAHPEIKVELVGMGSIDAAQAILDGTLQPTIWSPADTMAMNLLTSDWQTKNHADLIAPSKRVLAIQRALSDFGYGQIKPTGQYDPETRAAIEKFERDRKLPVTGQMSDRFVRELAAMTGRPLE